MKLKTAIEILEYHQEWRLGKRENMIHEPKELTEALDIVLSEVKRMRSDDNSGQSEQFFCCKEQIERRCREQCLGCFQFENADKT